MLATRSQDIQDIQDWPSWFPQQDENTALSMKGASAPAPVSARLVNAPLPSGATKNDSDCCGPLKPLRPPLARPGERLPDPVEQSSLSLGLGAWTRKDVLSFHFF